jgi:hypothetical protein
MTIPQSIHDSSEVNPRLLSVIPGGGDADLDRRARSPRKSRKHVEILATDTPEEKIAKGKVIVGNVAKKLARQYQKSYIELDDIEAAGYASMIRTIDLAGERTLALEKRIAKNAERSMKRDFIRKEVREYSYCQEALGDAIRNAAPHAQGVVVKYDTDAHPHDPLKTRGEILRERQNWSEDRDSPLTQAIAECREAGAEDELEEWRCRRDDFWSDIRVSEFDRESGELRFPCRVYTTDAQTRLAEKTGLKTRSVELRRGYRSAGAKPKAAWKAKPWVRAGKEGFGGWIYGYRFTVCRKWRTEFRDLEDFYETNGELRLPEGLRTFHSRPILECSSGKWQDGNRLRPARGYYRKTRPNGGGPLIGYRVQDVRVKDFSIPYRH